MFYNIYFGFWTPLVCSISSSCLEITFTGEAAGGFLGD